MPAPPSLAIDSLKVGGTEMLATEAVVAEVSGLRASGCLVDSMLPVTGTVGVADLRDLTAACKRSDLAFFSKANGLEVVSDVSWSDGVVTMASNPAAPIMVELAVWYPASDNVGNTRADLDIASAVTRYADSRTGMKFKAATAKTYPDPANPGDVPIVGNSCAGVANLRTMPGSPYYDAKRVNVYYVLDVFDQATGLKNRGFSCFEQAGGDNVIYLPTSTWHQPTTLAHELGHALGLRFGAGHVGPYGGNPALGAVGEDNIMYPDATWNSPSVQIRFMLGQVYRMNVDLSSWVNIAKLRIGQFQVACQADAALDVPCVRLTADWSGP